MPTRHVGHQDRPAPGLPEPSQGNHPSDGQPGRLSETLGTLEAREVPRSPSPDASPPSPPQGDNAGFVSPKLRRFRLREAHRPLARSKNQKKCGRVRIKSEVEVSRRLDQDEGGAHFHGLVRCGSWSACPVCSAAIAARRGQEIEEAIRNHQENGGEVLLVTVTLRHHKGHSLKELIDVLGDSWRYMKAGGSWQGGKRRRDGTRRVGWKERIGYVGAIGGTEATYGNEHGWHPHKHVLFLLEKPIPNEVFQGLLRFLRERWAKRVSEHHGLPAPSWEHGVNIVRGENAARYIAKMGLSREVAGIHQKEGRNGNLTPFQILGKWADEEDQEAREKWEEWTEAMHGKAQLFWSQGLRARLLPDSEELTDEEIVEGEDGPEELVAIIPGNVWDKIRDRPNLPAEILCAADLGGKAARVLVQGIIARELSHRVPPSRAPPGTTVA